MQYTETTQQDEVPLVPHDSDPSKINNTFIIVIRHNFKVAQLQGHWLKLSKDMSEF